MRRGFTIIEILVGLSITALLFAGGYAAYRDFAQRQVLVQASQNLSANLSLARQRALSGERPASCAGSESLLGYRVVISESQYVTSAQCGTRFVVVDTISFTEGVTAQNSSTVFYKVLGEGTLVTGSTEVRLQSSSGGTFDGTLSSDGNIKWSK